MSLSDNPDRYRIVITGEVEDSKNSENLPDISQGICLRTEVERFEKELIKRALILAKGRQKVAARLLGLIPSTLHSKIKKHNLQMDERKPLSK